MKQLIRRWMAHGIAKLPTGILHGIEHADIFERAGIHITRDYFYEPIANRQEIDPALWDNPSHLSGLDRNTDEQLAFLRDICALGYLDEYHRLPSLTSSPVGYSRDGGFGGIDGALLYATIRKFRPARIMEIGAGQSTLLSTLTLKANGGEGRLTAIDPYPQPYLRALDDPRFTLIEEKVERVPLSFFDVLNSDDILFIDSSHVIKIGSDVIYEILEILPRLRPGVLIHIHDIFLPHHYPKQWVLNDRKNWTEQYLVQAFLAFNSSFKIFWSSAMMETWHRDKLLPHFPNLGGASLWLRRVT
jgi:predicted O-methyltransferase YrrM